MDASLISMIRASLEEIARTSAISWKRINYSDADGLTFCRRRLVAAIMNREWSAEKSPRLARKISTKNDEPAYSHNDCV
jgi:hypothetical protein